MRPAEVSLILHRAKLISSRRPRGDLRRWALPPHNAGCIQIAPSDNQTEWHPNGLRSRVRERERESHSLSVRLHVTLVPFSQRRAFRYLFLSRSLLGSTQQVSPAGSSFRPSRVSAFCREFRGRSDQNNFRFSQPRTNLIARVIVLSVLESRSDRRSLVCISIYHLCCSHRATLCRCGCRRAA
jgi:hypothetical protein